MTNDQRLQYAGTLKRLFVDLPNVPIDDIGDAVEILGTLEVRFRRLHERQCNGYRNDADEAKDDRLEKRLRQGLARVCATLGLQARINGDPRGCAIRLLLPSGRSNSMDGETWIISWTR
jgi:hypothetical protein